MVRMDQILFTLRLLMDTRLLPRFSFHEHYCCEHCAQAFCGHFNTSLGSTPGVELCVIIRSAARLFPKAVGRPLFQDMFLDFFS